MGEELGLGQGIGGIDTEKRLCPGRLNPRGATDLDPPADSQPVRDAGITPRWQVDVAYPSYPRPHLVADGEAGDLFSASSCGLVIGVGEAKPGAPFWQVVPAVTP